MKIKKNVIIIVTGAVVLLAVLVAVGLSVINNVVEKELISKLDKEINTNNLGETFNYSGIELKAQNGLIIINDVEFINEGQVFNFKSVELKLPLSEAASLAKNPMNTLLTDMEINITGIKITNEEEGIVIEQDSLTSTFNGVINTQLFNEEYISKNIDSDFLINKVSTELKNLKILSPIGLMNIQGLTFDLNGDFKPSSFDDETNDNVYQSLLNEMDNMSFNLDNYKFEAEQEIRGGITMLANMFLGDATFVGNQDNWEIEKLTFETDVDENVVSINNLDLITKWINLNLEASITIEETFENFTPFELNIEVKNYMDELRPVFEMFVDQMTETELPEGNFSFGISQSSMNNLPKINIEKLN